MLRALNVGLAIATMRLLFVPAIVAFGGEHASMLSIVSFTIAFTVHAAFAEAWIRRTRERAVPEAARGHEVRLAVS
jgi:putative effector of murein hydrolase LrgA (UPF0299 family)